MKAETYIAALVIDSPVLLGEKPKSMKRLQREGSPQFGWSLLHAAVWHGADKCAERMLKDGWYDVDVENFDGTTPLALAAERRITKLAKLLLKHDADVEVAMDVIRERHAPTSRASAIEFLIEMTT